jgi:lipopolysaccharide export LptBFGC system permease protein LptF
LFQYWNNETLAPWTNHQSNTILRKAVLKKVLPELSQDLFFKDPENRIFYIHEINSETREAHHVLIVEPTGEFPRTITAQKAVLEEGQWRLSEGVIHRYDAQGHLAQEAEFDTMTIAMEKDVSELFTPPKGPKEMSRRELGEQIQLLQKSGLPATELRMEYHFKFAAPFACLIFALMGLALVLALIKQPREWWGVVIAAMLAVLASGFYMTLTAVFRALGHGGFVDPFWAAWGPNGVFVVIAMGVLAWRTNR